MMNSRKGFTLIEVMISVVLVLLILAGILSSVTYLSRADISVYDYAFMGGQQRRLLERFGTDVRQFTSVTNFSSTSFSGTVPSPSGSGSSIVTYTYDPAQGTLTRSVNGSQTTTLLTNITAFSFTYYSLSGSQLANGSNSSAVKQVRLSVTCTQKVLSNTENDKFVSAKYTIRAT